jgi:PAS domain-containing protein
MRCCGHELTIQAEMQAGLEESEARYRAIFERSAVGIVRLYRQGRIFEVNDTLCQMLGYTREELLPSVNWSASPILRIGSAPIRKWRV